MNTCKHCGKEFKSKDKRIQYCDNCKVVQKICPVCGTHFSTYRTREFKHCSRGCSNEGKATREGKLDSLKPVFAPMIATELHRGKGIERIAKRNGWGVTELKQFIQDHKGAIQRQFEVCSAKDYPYGKAEMVHDARIRRAI